MDTYSNEEKVSKQFLLKEKVDIIINIVDGSNLYRNLYLTLQLKQFNVPIVLVVNMIDAAENKGIKIDFDKLANNLGLKIIPISASKNLGVSNLINFLEEGHFYSSPINN